MRTKLKPYWQALLDIFRYHLATKLVIGLWLYALGRIFNALLLSTGRVAVSSGDYAFLFTSWQG